MKIKTVITGIAVLGGLLAVGGGLAYWKYSSIRKAAEAPPMPEFPTSVELTQAGTVKWRQTAQLSGTVIALQSVVISNEVAGVVKEVLFESGSLVEAGQVLLTLDTSTEEADLAAAQANSRVAQAAVRTSEAELAWSEANYHRMVQASEAKVVPVADLDRAKSDFQGSTAKVDKAKAELEQAAARELQVKTVIAKKTLRAPFKGVVGLRETHPGQYLKEGTQIVGLQSATDRIYLDFALPQDQAQRVSPGAVVMASCPVLGDEPVRIEVVALDAVADASTRNIRVRSIVDNVGQKLRPGMFVDVSVPVGDEAEQIAIPMTAVRRASYGDHVFVVEQGEKPDVLRAHQRFIKLGPSIGDKVIVADGLKPGERIAASGSFKLHEHALVMPAPPPGSPPAGSPVGSPAGPNAVSKDAAGKTEAPPTDKGA